MFDIIPQNNQTWLVCGGRDFRDREVFDSAMYDLVRLKGMPKKIIHGDAKGADTMVNAYAIRHALGVQCYPADWTQWGKAAGPIRNQQMLDFGKPDFVIAFPGGRGTADMVKRARKAKIDVAEIIEKGPEP